MTGFSPVKRTMRRQIYTALNAPELPFKTDLPPSAARLKVAATFKDLQEHKELPEKKMKNVPENSS